MAATGITVAVATPDDKVAVSMILAASYMTLWTGWYEEEALQAALPHVVRANPALLASGRYFLAHVRGVPAACGGWSADPPTDGSSDRLTHVRHFATHPAFLRRGLAAALLERSVAQAKAAGLKRMEALSSLQAEAFYARHGFKTVAATELTLPGGLALPGVTMRRDL